MSARKGLQIRGGGWMTLDWVPGAGLAGAGGFLSWWRSSIQTEQKVQAMRQELTKHEEENDDLRQQITTEMRASYDRLNELFTRMQVMTTEQTAFIKLCTSTLEGMAKKLEFHDAMLMQHQTSIEVLKAGKP